MVSAADVGVQRLCFLARGFVEYARRDRVAEFR
jgi:hypothetical protein